jgi:hypothetical protein
MSNTDKIKAAAMDVFKVLEKIPYMNTMGEYQEPENVQKTRIYYTHGKVPLVLDIYATHGKYTDELKFRGIENVSEVVAILKEFINDPVLNKYNFTDEIREKVMALINLLSKVGGRRRRRQTKRRNRSRRT